MDQARPKPVILAILDGWGIAPPWGGNAISLAKTPFMNMAVKHYPYTTIAASGEAVGLPDTERGNSEVGHLNIGSGRIVLQYYPAISKAISNQSFFQNSKLIEAFTRAKNSQKAVHIIGLVSPGGIHSHIEHLYALLEMAKRQNCQNVYIHAITDGRDTPPFIAQEHLAHLNQHLAAIGFGAIATVSGRYYTMDRDHRWERIEKSYRAMTEGVGPTAQSAEGAVAESYRKGFSDEFVQPTVITGGKTQFQPIRNGDSIIFFNFRGDRAREITHALVDPEFKDFERKVVLKDVFFVGFTFYEEGLPIEIAFQPHDVSRPLAYVLSQNNIKQLHIAESEKYAHVTYFFNGGNEERFPLEDRIVIPSPKIPSYDQKPEMSCVEITDALIKNINKYDFFVINYANPDMLGHTGNLRATIKACEIVDSQLERIYEAMKDKNAVFMITADHGNAEQMINPKTGEIDTEHTNNPVPFILISTEYKNAKLRTGGKLSDIVPTILEVMSLEKDPEMTGQSLIERSHESATFQKQNVNFMKV